MAFQGRLGNILFQYAYGLALARKYPKISVSYINHGIDPTKFDFTHGPPLINPPSSSTRAIIIKEPDYFQPPQDMSYLINADPKIKYILLGYWQSTKFFEPQVGPNDIRTFAKVAPIPPNPPAAPGRFDVSLHVRRGDYVQLGHVFHQLGTTYYTRALREMAKQLLTTPDQLNVHIFSDSPAEIELIHALIHLGCHVQVQSSNDMMTDFQKMMGIDNHIIANSSFSWWAAYLRTNVGGGVVICPRNWFINGMGANLPAHGWLLV
jgi:hypothetical protein